MGKRFSKRSFDNLKGVDPRLVVMAADALQISHIDFVVIEGVRTPKRQRELVAAGASRTLDSQHLTGHAIDVAAWVDGVIRWDWPLYYSIAEAFKASANRHGIPLTWGGDWESFRDGPHFEIQRG